MTRCTVCVLVAMVLGAGVVSAGGPDHELFDFRGKDTPKTWHLNIYLEDVPGR